MSNNERGAGRKKKSSQEKRVHRKSLYLNDTELEMYHLLEEALKKQGMGTMHQHLRNSITASLGHFYPRK